MGGGTSTRLRINGLTSLVFFPQLVVLCQTETCSSSRQSDDHANHVCILLTHTLTLIHTQTPPIHSGMSAPANHTSKYVCGYVRVCVCVCLCVCECVCVCVHVCVRV